jgi:two-component system sensor histidine kinase UhpB
VLKHADAGAVTVTLRQGQGGHIYLSIRDNGCGFVVDKQKTGMGLNNIRNRIEVYNGKMEIVSDPGKGCLLEVEF